MGVWRVAMTGEWASSLVGGLSCKAFVPHPLPPKPSL
jgi:hypothetical protein